jgi:hypothetical protein
MLIDTLQIPDPITMAAGYHAPALEALILMCACLCSPKDQHTLSTKYHCLQSAISQITHEVMTFISCRWLHLIKWDVHSVLAPSALKKYANVFGFLNCTIHQTCCTSVLQRLVYTSYMKFQVVVVPNSMIMHLGGPYRVPQNDVRVLGETSTCTTTPSNPDLKRAILPSDGSFSCIGTRLTV